MMGDYLVQFGDFFYRTSLRAFSSSWLIHVIEDRAKRTLTKIEYNRCPFQKDPNPCPFDRLFFHYARCDGTCVKLLSFFHHVIKCWPPVWNFTTLRNSIIKIFTSGWGRGVYVDIKKILQTIFYNMLGTHFKTFGGC